MMKKIISIVGVALALATSQVLAEGTFADSGACPVSLQMTQNLKAPNVGESYIRNGNYHWYTKQSVTEAHVLQQHLNRLGFDAGKVDGVIGPNTKGAILRMQEYLGTKQDGYVGPNTRELLNNSCGSNLDLEDINDDSWEEKYDQEDIELSRKAYTDDYAYSDYVAGEFTIDTKIKINDKNTSEYMHAEISADVSTAFNIPELEMEMDMNISYDVNTNNINAFYDFEQIAESLHLNYKDFMVADLKISAVVKDLDAYVKVSDIPHFFWDVIEDDIESYNKVAVKKVVVRDIKKYEDEWIKIEASQGGKEFLRLMMKSILPEIKKESLDQAKLYRERPFIIIDESSKVYSGGYQSYNATFDLDNLIYISERTQGSGGAQVSYSNGQDTKELIQQNSDALENVRFKVYLDTRTDELRKISFDVDLDLDEIEKDVEMEVSLDFELESTHLSNTKRNSISVPVNAKKWEDIFEDIFGERLGDLKYGGSLSEIDLEHSLDTANDASTRAYIESLRVKAAIEFSKTKSYYNVCDILDQKIQNISGFICNDSGAAYAVEAELSSGYYCVDSRGSSLNLVEPLQGGLVCGQERFSDSLMQVSKVSDDDYIIGDISAEIFVIEYSDLEGPFSTNFYNNGSAELKKKYSREGDVAFVYRPFPLETIHPYAFDAAVSGECVYAEEGGKDFFAFLDKVYTGDIKDHEIYAKSFILNREYNACIEDNKAKERIEDYFVNGIKDGVQGIPSVMIQLKNGSSYQVPSDFETIDNMLQEWL